LGRENKLVDFTYIDDAAEAHLLAANRLYPGSPVSGRAFFITQGRPIPLWEFVNRVLQAADLAPVTKSIPPRLAYFAGWFSEVLYRALPLPGEPPMTRFLAEELSTAHWFDISAARKDLGYEPRTTMEDGFRELGAWLRRESRLQTSR
jgi:nucleoside-diphosphate-sugar epimerase